MQLSLAYKLINVTHVCSRTLSVNYSRFLRLENLWAYFDQKSKVSVKQYFRLFGVLDGVFDATLWSEDKC